MHILLVSPVLPYPPNWGFGKRVYHLLEVLSRTHRVSLLSYGDGDDDAHVKAIESHGVAVHRVPSPQLPFGKRMAQLASVASSASFQRRTMYTDDMQRTLDELSRGEPFDIIQVESSQLACFRFDRRSIVVLDEHNIEYELYYRMYQTERSVARRFFNWIEYRKFRREEIASWHDVSGCVMTSQREVEILRALAPATPSTAVPNAVDTEFFRPSGQPVDPDAIVLTGLMKYRPNVDAAIHFVHDILPRILAKRPNAVFYVVGGEAPPEVTRLASAHVVVTGSVEDVRPYVHRAAVFAVSLRMGGGTRLKVLEGLSMGKPMVSTALGCEGIDVVHGEHLLIADDAEAFAGAVLDLMTQPELAGRLAGQGRDLMLRQYRWEAAAQELEAFYGRLGRDRTGDAGLVGATTVLPRSVSQDVSQ
jgi:glycosyltransferase involved in cell wall biosynthesis